MGTNIAWNRKAKMWELYWLQDTPIERIREQFPIDPKEGTLHSWATVDRAIKEFPSLSGAKVHQLSEALQARWREVRSQVEQERPTEPPAEPQPYKAQPYKAHEETMRKLVDKLAARINLPSLFNGHLWDDLPVDFQPGRYCLPIGVVEITEDKQIRVNYYDVSADLAAPRLAKRLDGHLRTSGLSGFAELAGDEGKLNNWVVAVGQYSEALMMLLKLITDEVKDRANVNFHNEVKPGLTRWFITTVWVDAIQLAGGHSWISNSWYKPPGIIANTNLWKLDCGTEPMCIARSKKTLETYENWHKQLRHRYANETLPKSIATKRQELSDLADEIRQRLSEFRDMEQLPGHCELCYVGG